MQGGQVFKHGRFWCLRWREKVLVAGEMKSVRKFQRLAPYNQASKTEAQKLADEIVGALPGALPESIDTIGHYMEAVYMPHIRESLKPATAETYLNYLRAVKSTPWFGSKRLAEITTADIHQFLQEYAARPVRGRQRGQSAITNCRSFLSGGLRWAINSGLLKDNPVRDAITPKGRRKGETHAYTLAEIHAMLAVVGRVARTLILLAALTGLRKSEIQGLKWKDFDGEVLHVRRQVWKGNIQETKTEGSEGDVPLLPIVAEALAEHKSHNGFNDWVFHGATGNPLFISDFTYREMLPALKKAGLKWQGWHAFRRGLGTNLSELGCPPKMTQAILRHANIATTMAFYIKARPEATAAQMAKLETAFKAAAPARKTA